METRQLVLHAQVRPIPGVNNPGPHQTYVNPQVTVESRDLKELDANYVRLEMVYAGLCGTDVHMVEKNPETGYIKSSAPAFIPPEGRVIGHEGVGKVVAVGRNVSHIPVGSYVTCESIIVCHYCDICRKGNFNQCRHAKLLGLEEDGLFGTVVDVPAMLTHDVTDLAGSDKDLRAAACVEPAGVAYVACENTRVHPGDVVVVFGGGPIGLFCAMLSKIVFGASLVYVVEPVEFRRNLAKSYCDYAMDVEEFFGNCPKAVDVVMEASGDMTNVNRIFRKVSANGRMALLARSGAPLALDALDHMITNAIFLIGSRGHLCGAFVDILNLYKAGRIPLGDLVTEVVPGLDALAETLQSTRRIINENCKVLVKLSAA